MNRNLAKSPTNSVGHPPRRIHLIVIFLVGLALLFIAGRVVAQEGQLPVETPDAAAGVTTYADRCANCHGDTGQGDGELAADLPNPPAAHASEEYLRAAVPSAMFDVITNGRVERGMPPFGPASSDPISDAGRWDLIAAIYSYGTPVESVEEGQVLYEENCLACHGEAGVGDGPEAENLGIGDYSAISYWYNASNQAVFDRLNGDQIAEHQYELDEEALWSVVDYMRTFSYGYTDALAPFRPIEEATISGQIFNGTTGEPTDLAENVVLRAFTTDLNLMLEEETTVDEGGNFVFNLNDVPQDWFFRVSTSYNDVDFGSDFDHVSFDQPDLELPIIVYDPSTDPGAITIDRLHMVLGFDSGRLLVSEVYIASNNEPTIFMGESGDVTQGTFELYLPDGADEVTFQRSFGSVDSFIPAEEVIQTDSGWADTVPVRPGQGSLMLIVLYSLPYDNEATLAHNIAYDTGSVNLIVSDTGISVLGANWQSGGTQSLETGAVDTYAQLDLAANSEIVLSLEGEPSLAGGQSTSLLRNNATELAIGLGVSAGVIGIAALLIRRWRQEPGIPYSREELLQELADLDDAYEAGEIEEVDYHQERELIKADLLSIWQDESEI